MRKRIIELLKKDARYTPEDIAKMLDTSEDIIKKEISKLENEKIIVQYSAVINDEKLNGNGSVTAFIEVKVTPERDKGFDDIANRLEKFPEVQSVYLMSGAYDLLVVVQGDSLKEVARFVSEKLAPFGNVLSTATHFLLKKYKENGILMEQDIPEPSRLKVVF
ncbi:MAG: AsnC family transcriptional regulator [Candidatus Margulisbacteria bacterium GWF2_35_9]|nr:MAG: AsnC family transcriptional regulator [Candidatus Margulisbacteria bacterium GWF2_35_9]